MAVPEGCLLQASALQFFLLILLMASLEVCHAHPGLQLYEALGSSMEDPAGRRHLLHIWVAPPDGWLLPEAIAGITCMTLQRNETLRLYDAGSC